MEFFLSSSFLLIMLLIVDPGWSKKYARLNETCTINTDCVSDNSVCNRTLSPHICQCKPEYPIHVQLQKGIVCAKGAGLGQDCLADDVCLSQDENSRCAQEGVKAICNCKEDFDTIYDKTQKKDRCVREAQLFNSDLVTLLIVGSAMTLFCILTCLVLRIFARARFGTGRSRFASATIPPAVTLSAEDGDHRPPHPHSRNSSQRSSLAESSRRQSGSLLAPPTRPDSRRASNSSIKSTGSSRSQRSYSLRAPNSQYHPSLQHRPSDPETRSNISGGSATSVTFNIPPGQGQGHSSTAFVQKSKRSGSAGTLPV